MAVDYTSLLPSGYVDRWHNGTGQITYSFPTTLPDYYTTRIDTNGDTVNDAIEVYKDGLGSIAIPLSNLNFGDVTESLANAAVAAWNEVANVNLVHGAAGGGYGIPGNGTLVTGLGNVQGYTGGPLPSGFGENVLGHNVLSATVNLAPIFEDGLNFYGTVWNSIFISPGGGISFDIDTPGTLPQFFGTRPQIAPFLATVQTAPYVQAPNPNDPSHWPGTVIYDLDAVNDVLTVTWAGVDYNNVRAADHVRKFNYYQVQLYDRDGGDFDIVFRYQSMEWTTADPSGGVNGLGGNPAVIGVSGGTPATSTEIAASRNESALLNLPETPGNTGVNGLWLFQIRNEVVAPLTPVDGIGDIAIAAFNFIDQTGAPETSTYGAMSSLNEHLHTGVPGMPGSAGDVWINLNIPEQQPGNPRNAFAADGYDTYLHELGHSLGLRHPGGDGNHEDYTSAETVMSYNPVRGVVDGADWPITPMVLDIEAVQELYGANLGTRTGDTVYFGPGANAFAMADGGLIAAGQPGAGHQMIMTIWDAGGNDTINAANQTGIVAIDLTPGHYSSIGTISNNIGIAETWIDPATQIEYGWIENAVGGLAGDFIIGNDRANVIDGGPSADIMRGGNGNDTYGVDNPADIIEELPNQGVDLVLSLVTYTLSADVDNLTLKGAGPLNGTGNAIANVIIGNPSANMLDGRGGADDLRGGGGDDTYFVDDTNDLVTEAVNQGTDTVFSSADFFELSANIENLTLTGIGDIGGLGNDLANIIIGNSGWNIIDGGIGADTMRGGAGDDLYGVDLFSDVIIENPNEGDDAVLSTVDYTLGPNLEELTLSGFATNGTGNDQDNRLFGQFNAVNNVLDGRGGNDIMRGFLGNDTYFVDGGDQVIEEANGGTDTVNASVSHTLAPNVETLALQGANAVWGVGNELHNTMFGNFLDNTLDGGPGADTMRGSAGNDNYVLDDSFDNPIENPDEGIDTIYTRVPYTLPANIENISLTGDFAIDATGNALGNIMLGNAQNNTMSGGAGIDYLAGSLGNDTLNGGGDGDALHGGEGDDTQNGDAGDDVLVGLSGNDVLRGGVGNDTLIGGDGLDLLEGGDGNDQLFGYGDGDMLYGGAGGDFLSGGDGIDTLNGGDGDDSIHGEGGNDFGNGEGGNDAVVGQDGNDTLTGGAGNDTLVGHGGDDQLNGDEGNDQVFGGDGVDLVQGGDGDDFIAGGDNPAGPGARDALYGGAGGDVLDGEAGNDLLFGDADGDNLNGGLGDDELYGGFGNDGITGRDGNDILDGGAGNDFLIGDRAEGGGPRGNDTFVFYLGSGNDNIADMQAGAGLGDVIDIRNFGFASFAAVMAVATDLANGVYIQLSVNDAILVEGRTKAQFAADDFLIA